MSDKNRILVIQGDPAAAASAAAALSAGGHAVTTVGTGKEGLIEAWRSRPDLIVVDWVLPDLPGLELVRRLRADQRTAQTRMLIYSTKNDLKDMLEAKHAGVNDYVTLRPGGEGELLQKVGALLPPAGPAASAPPGKLISVMSAKGGVGTSSITANLAHSVATLAADKRVAVVDLVLPLGSISQIVGATSPGTIVDAARLQPAQLTPEMVGRMVTPVPPWKFFLFSGPPDPQQAHDLQLDRLETLFTSLGRAFDFVFVDLGRALARVSLPIVYHSLAVVLVISPDSATVALTKIALKYLETQGVIRSRMFPVLNRAVGLEGMSRAELEAELGFKVAGLIPHLDNDFTLANHQHQPVINHVHNESTRFVFRDLAAELLARLERAGDSHDHPR